MTKRTGLLDFLIFVLLPCFKNENTNLAVRGRLSFRKFEAFPQTFLETALLINATQWSCQIILISAFSTSNPLSTAFFQCLEERHLEAR